MNYDAVAEYLTVGRVLSTDTFTKNKSHNIKIPNIGNAENGCIDDVIDVLSCVIEKEVSSKSKVAISLSGGKDSRLLVALCKHLCLEVDCITWTGGDNKREVESARKVSKVAGYDHKVIKLNGYKFFDDKYAEKSIKITDGNPAYFTLVPYYIMESEMEYDVIFDGNMMTEFMDAGEYRWYNGSDVRKGLLSKENILPLVIQSYHDKVNDKLNRIFAKDENQVIVERKIDRLISGYLRKKHFNIISPAMYESVLSEVFSLPLKERIGSRLVRNMIKKLSPELYRVSTSRSPLSLRYPLWIHQAYQKLFKTTAGFDFWKDGLRDVDTNSLLELDLEMLDKNRLKTLFSGEKTGVYCSAVLRLMNIQKWLEVNH